MIASEFLATFFVCIGVLAALCAVIYSSLYDLTTTSATVLQIRSPVSSPVLRIVLFETVLN